jgi:hypothetical protein
MDKLLLELEEAAFKILDVHSAEEKNVLAQEINDIKARIRILWDLHQDFEKATESLRKFLSEEGR